jgi:predicted RNase H-like HicB family nuclease
MTKPLLIQADWDDEARVWVATSDDVPGLATEADTIEQLLERLKVMVPELLEANGCGGVSEATVPFELVAKRTGAAPREGEFPGLEEGTQPHPRPA